jgi:sugar lactone lactonase YvrE
MGDRRRSGLGQAIALLAATGVAGGVASASTSPPADIVIGKSIFPESLSAAPDGSLFVGSIKGGVLRVSRRGEVSRWLAPGASDTRAILGVVVDAPHRTLWLCSNDLSAIGITESGGPAGSWLRAFDLASARAKASYRLPGDKAFCNDMAVADDGTLYLTATGRDVMRLRPGAKALELWVNDARIQPGHDGGADGIAFGNDGNLYVTSIGSGLLFRVTIGKDDVGQVTQLTLDRPLVRPDALRSISGNSFALIEGGGSVDRVDIRGDQAVITVLKDGLDEPTGVTVTGRDARYVEGRLSWVFDPAKRNRPFETPFRVSTVRIR